MTDKKDLRGCALLVLLAVIFGFSWYAPWFALLVGAGLLTIGRKYISARAGGGVAAVGLVMLVVSFLFVCSQVSSCTAQRREENERRLANEQIKLANERVAAHVKIAQGLFDKDDLDGAERELNNVPLIANATDTQAANDLQSRIQGQRKAAMAERANQEVSEHVAWAEFAFTNGNLQSAESRLARALAVEGATETVKAKELLIKMQAALQAELFRSIQQAVDKQNYREAVQKLSDYLTNPLNAEAEKPAKLLRLLQLIGDDDKAKSFLQSMTDQQFAGFSETGKLPADVTVDVVACTEAVEAALAKHIASERNRRERERLASLEAERRLEAEEARRQPRMPKSIPSDTPTVASAAVGGLGRTERNILDNLREYFPLLSDTTPVRERPRRMGQTADSLAHIEIIGDPEDVESASVMVGFPSDAPTVLVRNTGICLILLHNALPDWSERAEWFNGAVTRIVRSTDRSSEEIKIGNVTVHLIIIKSIGLLTLTIKRNE